MKNYRLQRAEFLGIVHRAFGGRVASYSKWRTIEMHPEKEAALSEMDLHAKRPGLFRLRVVYGSAVVGEKR